MLKKILFFVSLFAVGCTSTPREIGAPGIVQRVEANELPKPAITHSGVIDGLYRIGPSDRLLIDVYGIEELEPREVQVDAGGQISYPLAGVVNAAGKTGDELALDIRARLQTAHIRDPKVTVNIKENRSQIITVDGEVVEPGVYPMVTDMTLMRAVATAKGASENAKLDDVVVFRSVDGTKYAALYNLKAIRRGMYADPVLYSNDIVVVGDSASRRLFKDLLQIVPVLTTPLVVAIQ